MSDEDVPLLELTQFSEDFTDKSKQVAELLAKRALSELHLAGQIEFNPLQESEELDLIKRAALRRLHQISQLDIIEQLRSEKNRAAALVKESDEDGDELEEILISEPEPTLKEILEVEIDLAKIIAKHRETVQTCMREKRFLAGQMYGSQAQSQSLNRAVSMQRAVIKGNKALEHLAKSGALTLDPHEELEMVGGGRAPKAIPEYAGQSQKISVPEDIEITPIDPKKYQPKPNFAPEAPLEEATEDIPKPFDPHQEEEESLYCEDF